MSTIATLNVAIDMDTKGFDQGVGKMSGGVNDLGASLTKGGKAMTMAFTAPIVAGAAASVKAFASFDDAMTQSLAIMGDLDAGMRQTMEETARDVAKSTTFAANEVAEAYFFLASAGLDAEQSIAALPQVAKFAQAGMFDLATATDLVTDAQSALGLSSADAAENLENMTRLTDVLVGANTLANASVEQFSKALTSKAGVAMRNFGIELEDGVAILAAFADAGIKGEQAGTMYARTLQGLAENARKNSAEFERFGVTVFDANGVMRPTVDIIRDMEKGFAGLTMEQQFAALQQMGFNRLAMQGIQTLIGQSGAVDEYGRQLRDMGGITEEVAEKQLESFNAQMSLAKSAIMDVAIELGAKLAPSVVGAAKGIASLVQWFANLPTPVLTVMGAFAALLAVIGPIMLIAGKLIVSFTAVKGAILGLGLAAGVGAGSLLLIVGAIVAVTAAVIAITVLIVRNWESIKNWTQNVWSSLPGIIQKYLRMSLAVITLGMSEVVMAVARNWDRITGFFRKGGDDAVREAERMGHGVVGEVIAMRLGMETEMLALEVSGGTMSAAAANAIITNLNQMRDKGIRAAEEFRSKSLDALTFLATEGGVVSASMAVEITERIETMASSSADAVATMAQSIEARLRELEASGVTITEDIVISVSKEFAHLEDEVVQIVTRTNAGAMAVYEQLKMRAGAVTKEMASEVIGRFAEAREESIAEAQALFEGVVENALLLRQAGVITDQEYSQMVHMAEGTRQAMVAEAESTFNGVVSELEGMGVPIGREIDATTGEIRSRFQIMRSDVGESLGGFGGMIYDNIIGPMTDARRDIISGASSIASTLLETAMDIRQWFMELPGAMWEAVTGVGEAIGDLVVWFTELPGRIGEAIMMVVEFFRENMSELPRIAGEVIGEMVGRFISLPFRILATLLHLQGLLVEKGAEYISWAAETGMGIVTSIVNGIRALPGRVWEILQNLWGRFLEWRSSVLEWASTTGSGIITNIINFIQQLPGRIAQLLAEALSRAVAWGADMIARGRETASRMVSAVVEGLAKLPGEVARIYERVIAEVRKLITRAFNAVKDFAAGIWQGFKAGLGISSPSLIERAMWQIEDNLFSSLSHLRQHAPRIAADIGDRVSDGLLRVERGLQDAEITWQVEGNLLRELDRLLHQAPRMAEEISDRVNAAVARAEQGLRISPALQVDGGLVRELDHMHKQVARMAAEAGDQINAGLAQAQGLHRAALVQLEDNMLRSLERLRQHAPRIAAEIGERVNAGLAQIEQGMQQASLALSQPLSANVAGVQSLQQLEGGGVTIHKEYHVHIHGEPEDRVRRGFRFIEAVEG